MCLPSSHIQSCSGNEMGTILGTVPDAKWFWLQTCFPYCHYWSCCSGLITSWLCQPFQRELNCAPPPLSHVYVSFFHPPFPPLCDCNTLLITLELTDSRNSIKKKELTASSWRLARSTVYRWTRSSPKYSFLFFIWFSCLRCCQTFLATGRNSLESTKGEWVQLCTYWLI